MRVDGLSVLVRRPVGAQGVEVFERQADGIHHAVAAGARRVGGVARQQLAAADDHTSRRRRDVHVDAGGRVGDVRAHQRSPEEGAAPGGRRLVGLVLHRQDGRRGQKARARLLRRQIGGHDVRAGRRDAVQLAQLGVHERAIGAVELHHVGVAVERDVAEHAQDLLPHGLAEGGRQLGEQLGVLGHHVDRVQRHEILDHLVKAVDHARRRQQAVDFLAHARGRVQGSRGGGVQRGRIGRGPPEQVRKAAGRLVPGEARVRGAGGRRSRPGRESSATAAARPRSPVPPSGRSCYPLPRPPPATRSGSPRPWSAGGARRCGRRRE